MCGVFVQEAILQIAVQYVLITLINHKFFCLLLALVKDACNGFEAEYCNAKYKISSDWLSCHKNDIDSGSSRSWKVKKAVSALSLRISVLCLSFSPDPNISDGNFNIDHHFFRLQIFQINEKGASCPWSR